ncbi:MAG TPA: flagellar assembly protein FliH [Hydrogenophaga sp.]|nr:flagellar assembly protein FliH [Hydrogenophaga sp.]
MVNKNNPHSRFVPREEIDGVSAWQFSAVDGSDELTALGRDSESAPLIDEAAFKQAAEEAYAEGYAHGHEAGGREVRDALEATVRKVAEETAVRMAQLLHNTRDQLQKSEDQISHHILELACDLARQVVRQELHSDPGHLKPVITEALAQMVEDGLPATVRMHPSDLALMQGVLNENIGKTPPAFVADPGITPGGCLIESPSTSVDATIEKRWARAVGNLGMEIEWNPGNADV